MYSVLSSVQNPNLCVFTEYDDVNQFSQSLILKSKILPHALLQECWCTATKRFCYKARLFMAFNVFINPVSRNDNVMRHQRNHFRDDLYIACITHWWVGHWVWAMLIKTYVFPTAFILKQTPRNIYILLDIQITSSDAQIISGLPVAWLIRVPIVAWKDSRPPFY